MKRFIIIFVLFGLILAGKNAVCQIINQKQYNNKTKEEILIGQCTRDALLEGKYRTWFKRGYSGYGYLMNKKELDPVKDSLQDIKIVIVMGTWCSDSREQVPRFYRILDYMKFDENNVLMICVDRNKSVSTISIDEYNVVLVPTFIFYKEGFEIGRIVESPEESLEKDIATLINGIKNEK